jgi:hypothetical protein
MSWITALLVIALALPAFAADAEQEQALPWDQADKHIGKQVTIEGRVMGVHCSPLSCLLAFEPTFNRFTAVIQARSFDTFPPEELERKFSGQRVRVRGKVVERDSKPEIMVEKPEDLVLVVSRRQQEQRAAKDASDAQLEVLERIADVLERVEETAERMAEVQERLETLLVELEQREAALASVQSPPPAPPAPTYGEPQPRPGFEAMRTVKRGMSRADVERLVGPPEYVEGTTRGWQTWYYGYGRSISFDARGRAQALIGFPAP